MIKTQKWYTKQLDGCVSGNGKPYYISLKKGTINKLLVCFLGGGASWSEETAVLPITIRSLLVRKKGYYLDYVSPLFIKLGHVGLLAANDRRNPFHAWHVLYIPYSTADFHIGCNDFHYTDIRGKSKMLHHHGAKNVETALGLLKEFVNEKPDTIVISGMSAGAFGCLAHCRSISELYPNCENIVVYAEAAHLRSSEWQRITVDVWKVKPELAAIAKSEDLIYDLFCYARDKMPKNTWFLHSCSVWDEALSLFMYNMNHGGQSLNAQALQTFHSTLIEVIKKLKSDIPNYSYYLTDFGRKKDGTTPHIFFGSPKLLYNAMQDNTPLADWISNAIEKPQTDIGTKFILDI